MKHSTLIVSRNSPRDMKFRGIEVLLDGEFVGNLKFGDSLELPVEPGSHRLKATNRLTSKTIEIVIAGDETLEVETRGIALGGVWLLISMLGTVAYRVELEQVKT